MNETHVVTCFLRNRGEVLLLRRSEAVGSYQGQWGGVSGHAEGDPDAAAREEIAEETGLHEACREVRSGVTFEFTDTDLDIRWVVHPYLFDCDSRDVETNWETAEAEWVHPTEILRRETVPKLWASYSRVGPTIQQVSDDSEHGSAYISMRALEVLRDRAGSFAVQETGDWSVLVTLAEKLLDARPSMAAVGNRVNRAMATATEGVDGATGRSPEAVDGATGRSPEAVDGATGRSPEAVERAARAGIARAASADEQAVAAAAAEIQNATVLTLSRSGTVLDALPAAESVFVAESRPAREGVGVAEALADESGETVPDVTLHTDAAIAHVLATEEVDAVVIGADAVLPDGRVVNKTGSRAAALAAAREEIPVYAVAASDKVQTDDSVHLERGNAEAVYDGEADVTVLNPTFDVTPADLVSGVITERGMLDAEEVREIADELQMRSRWQSGA